MYGRFSPIPKTGKYSTLYHRYNYQTAGAPLITNVLFADSFKVVGTDTIYYLNRIVQKPNYISSYDTVLKNLPQFFQKQIRRSIDGTYVFSIDSGYDGFNPDTFVIKTQANVGDNWLYDTTANITATVAGQTLQILFGTTDLIKQINLSNGDSILLSKSFGIVGFPSDTLTASGKTPIYYNLSGIETRGIGDSVINFWSIYNFNVGDVFMYTDLEDGSVYNSNIQYKYTILNKQVFSDSINYLVRDVHYEYDWQYGGKLIMPPYSWIGNITIAFKDSATHFANSFPNQLVPYSYNEYANTLANMGSFSLYIFDTTYNVPCKGAPYFFDVIKSDTLLFQNQGYLNTLSCAVCRGIGDEFYKANAFESAINLQLIGYIKDGIQYGTVLSDGEITGVSNPTAKYPCHLHIP